MAVEISDGLLTQILQCIGEDCLTVNADRLRKWLEENLDECEDSESWNSESESESESDDEAE